MLIFHGPVFTLFTDSMNLLQHISEEKFGPVLVTLNSPTPGPREDKVVGRYQYEHPVISSSVGLLPPNYVFLC